MTDGRHAPRPAVDAARLGRFAHAAPIGLFVFANAALQWGVMLRNEHQASALAFEAPGLAGTLCYLGFAALLVSLPALVLLALALSEASVGWARRWRPLVPLVVAAEAALLIGLFADSRLFETMGLHLHSPLVWDVLSNPGVDRELHLVGSSTTSIGLFVGFVFVLQATMLWGAFWSGKLHGAPQHVGSLCVAGVLTLGVGGAVAGPAVSSAMGADASYLAAIPFYEPLFASEAAPLRPGAVHYPPDGLPALTMEQRPDIVFIVAESLRADAFGPELMPHAFAYAQREQCWTSRAHYSGAHTTEYGVFALLYSVYGANYEPFQRARVAPHPLRILRDHGYRLVGAAASGLRDWNGGAFMLDAFDAYTEFLDAPADVGDRQVVDALVGAMKGDAPRFLFAFFNATHHNYLYPPRFERHTPVLPRDYDHFMGDAALAERKTEIRNRYKNSVLYVDQLFADLMDGVDGQGRARIVVFTGDHGEEFWEHGLLGHGAPRFVAERVQVPLMICVPGQPRRTLALSSHVDVWPTVFELLGATRESTAGWTQGESLAHEERAHAVYVGGLDFPWDNTTAALIGREDKVWLRLCDGAEPCLEPERFTTADDRPLRGVDEPIWRDDVARLLTAIGRFVELE